QCFTHCRARRPRETYDRELDTAMRHDEGQELLAESVLADESEYRAQHEPIEAEDVECTETEQEPGAVREQRHHDVVGQDLYREDRRGHYVQQTLGPELAALDRRDEIGRCEER